GRAGRLSPLLLVAGLGVLGLEVLAADPAGDRPGRVLLGADPERPGRLAAAGHLKPLARLAGRLLPIAVLTLSLTAALATEHAQAAEGVAVQPDRRAQVGEGVGVVGQGLFGEGDLGEADDRMGPLALGPGQAEFAGEGDELAFVVVLATSRGVFDTAVMGEGVDGLVQHGLQGLAGTFGQALAGDEQLGPPAG